MKTEYLYKVDAKGKLMTSVSSLADPVRGSAIKSFRKMEELKSKLPASFWE
jgi:hypothetical protein